MIDATELAQATAAFIDQLEQEDPDARLVRFAIVLELADDDDDDDGATCTSVRTGPGALERTTAVGIVYRGLDALTNPVDD